MLYCDDCNCECTSKIEVNKRSYIINGHEFEAEIKILVCENCGSELYDEKLINESLKVIDDTYVKLFGMSVEEIRSIRSSFNGLGLRPFAKILGIGSASLSRHEAGSAPSEDHLSIYRELKEDPRRIFEYFERNKHNLSPRELKKATEVLDTWRKERSGSVDVHTEYMQDDEEIIESIHKPYDHTELNGFIAFNLEKFINMFLYFSQNGVNKTKLMKLMWFADFLNFKRQTVSISGSVYTRLQYGPVPKDHEITLAHLQHMGVIKIDERLLNDEGWTQMTVMARQPIDRSLFKNHELDVLEEVMRVFHDYGSRKISLYSHEELGWSLTADEQPIDYKYATALRDFENMN